MRVCNTPWRDCDRQIDLEGAAPEDDGCTRFVPSTWLQLPRARAVVAPVVVYNVWCLCAMWRTVFICCVVGWAGWFSFR